MRNLSPPDLFPVIPEQATFVFQIQEKWWILTLPVAYYYFALTSLHRAIHKIANCLLYFPCFDRATVTSAWDIWLLQSVCHCTQLVVLLCAMVFLTFMTWRDMNPRSQDTAAVIAWSNQCIVWMLVHGWTVYDTIWGTSMISHIFNFNTCISSNLTSEQLWHGLQWDSNLT